MKRFSVGRALAVGGVFLVSAGAVSAARAADAQWPTFRGGWLNAGRSPYSLDAAGAEEVSRIELGGLIWATPVIGGDGRIYVGSSNKRFFALDSQGRAQWQAQLFDRPDSLIDSAAALVPATGQVVVPGGDGDLHAFDSATGRAAWNFHAYGASDASHQSGVQVNSFEGNVQVGPNGWLYAGSDNGTLYCLDAGGREKWHFATRMMVWSSPAFAASGEWMAFGSLDGHLYVLDPATGALLASFDAGSDVKATVATDGVSELYFGASDGRFRALELVRRGGGYELSTRWSFKTRREIYSSAALGEDAVYFGSMDGQVYALDRRTGQERWVYTTYSPVASSPLLTADARVLAGAANGKLYALDARTGARLWSFQTSPETSQKANLDSSPALDAHGFVWVGSYQGTLHRIGARHCALHPEDGRCELGGTADTPSFGLASPPADGAFLRFEDERGRYGAQASLRVGRAQPIHLRLAVYREGRFDGTAAISAEGVQVLAERDGAKLPAGELQWSVSSDGKYLNIEPKSFLKGGANYRLRIRARYFNQSDWLVDRLQWFTLRSLEDTFEFSTEPELPTPALGNGWYLHSLYLTEPKALDTYIPAALDGQGFVVKPFGLTGGKLFVAVLPALPGDGGYRLLAEPARAAALEATVSGDAIRARGAFRISAMGGEIPFDDFELGAGLAADGGLRDGQLRAEASCLRMQGNGTSYHFPWALVDQVCDPLLKMKAYLVFRSDPASPSASPLAARLSADGGEWKLGVDAPPGLQPGDHLLTAVLYDADTMEILARSFQKARLAAGQPELRGELPGFAGAARGKRTVLQAFVDESPSEPIR